MGGAGLLPSLWREDGPVTGDAALLDVDRYEWERIVRRVRLNPATKLVALAVASYANRDGSSIYPGAAKLAAVTGLTERTVRQSLKTLREIGLLHRTREGRRAGRAALADEHKLTRPTDLIDRVHMLDPHESPETSSCDLGCTHKGSPVLSSGVPVREPVEKSVEKPSGGNSTGVEHRNSVPRTPELSSRTPELSDRNTGTQFPPPTHDHPGDHHPNQREDHLEDVTTEGASDDMLAKLIEIDRMAEARSRT
jgi:DNA-binding transcriptional ArsR family regulator